MHYYSLNKDLNTAENGKSALFQRVCDYDFIFELNKFLAKNPSFLLLLIVK